MSIFKPRLSNAAYYIHGAARTINSILKYGSAHTTPNPSHPSAVENKEMCTVVIDERALKRFMYPSAHEKMCQTMNTLRRHLSDIYDEFCTVFMSSDVTMEYKDRLLHSWERSINSNTGVRGAPQRSFKEIRRAYHAWAKSWYPLAVSTQVQRTIFDIVLAYIPNVIELDQTLTHHDYVFYNPVSDSIEDTTTSSPKTITWTCNNTSQTNTNAKLS